MKLTRIILRWLGGLSLLAATALGQAPAPAPAPAPAAPARAANLIRDEFVGEMTRPVGNYWDGVDDANDLHVITAASPALNNLGRMVGTPFSSFPNFADMNGDGLNDLVVADTFGFVWIFINSGEKGKPKFTTGKPIPTFIGWASKIHVCDWDDDGDNDIIVGTFYGDVAVLINYGAAKEWRFTRNMGIPRYVDPAYVTDDPAARLPQVRMGKTPMVLGNYMSPWVMDWNKDGKLDLILGEGTYSANSVRLVLNMGSRLKPVFVEDQVFYLAFGQGYEHLTPAVADYNGDGISDLLVGTRTGEILVYKGTAKAVEGKDMVAAIQGTLAPAVLEFDKTLNNGRLKIAGREVFSTMSNCFPCDWNEDGLIDLLLGHTDGKIYLALNKGTKTEPSFPEAAPVKGANVAKDLVGPSGWWPGIGRVTGLSHYVDYSRVDYYGLICNAAVLLSCEKEVQLRPGAEVLRPVNGNTFLYFRYVDNYLGWTRNVKEPHSVNVIGARCFGPDGLCTTNVLIGKNYLFSFSSVLEGKPVTWRLTGWESYRGDELKSDWQERREVTGNITPSTRWMERATKFKCPGTGTGIHGSNIVFYLTFQLGDGDAKFLVDNLSLKEVEK